MDIVRVFGSNVKRYRQAAGLSQEAFAEKCGMHRTYISAIESFASHRWTRYRLHQLVAGTKSRR